MSLLYLGLGSNLGQRQDNLERAMLLIQESIGVVLARSTFYCTQAWGFASEHEFLNACILVETSLDAKDCLLRLQAIERQLGRLEKTQNGIYHDRLIDLDILYYNNEIIDEKDLKVPHPLLHLREFVLQPLVEISPDFKHPILQKSNAELLNHLLKD